jgi:predicted kinase
VERHQRQPALRSGLIELFAGYGARVRIVYLEVPDPLLWERNRQRTGVVPQAVIERRLDRWEVPDRTEAHQVEWLVRESDGASLESRLSIAP